MRPPTVPHHHQKLIVEVRLFSGIEVPILTLSIQSAFLAWGAWQYVDVKMSQAEDR